MKSLTLCLLVLLAAVAPAQVVINEFNCGTPDFIELRNLSASPVNVGGWVLSTWQATGTALAAEPSFTIPSSVTIPANGTWVFQENGTAGAPGPMTGCSTSVGINYLWTDTRSIVVRLNNGGTVEDYVFRNATGIAAAAPNLGSGSWSGSFTANGNACSRSGDVDSDTAADWTAALGASPCNLNPGQQPVSPVTLDVSTSGGGQATVTISGSSGFAGREFYGLYSTQNYTPNGSGPFFGVGTDTIPLLFLPLVPGSPFHSVLDASGGLSVSYPAGTVPVGAFFEARVIVIDGGNLVLSNVDAITF